MESFFGSLKTELVHRTTSRPGRRPGGRSSSISKPSTTAGAVTPASAS